MEIFTVSVEEGRAHVLLLVRQHGYPRKVRLSQLTEYENSASERGACRRQVQGSGVEAARLHSAFSGQFVNA